MSAFHDQPNHFVDWLQRRSQPVDGPAADRQLLRLAPALRNLRSQSAVRRVVDERQGTQPVPGARPGGGPERRPPLRLVDGRRRPLLSGRQGRAGSRQSAPRREQGRLLRQSVASGRDDRRAAGGPSAVDRHRADDGRHRPVASGRRPQGRNPRSVASRAVAARARAGTSPGHRRRRLAENDVGVAARPLAAGDGAHGRGARVRMARGHRRSAPASAGSVAAAADRGAPPISAPLAPLVGDPPASHGAVRSGPTASSYATRATRRRRGQDRLQSRPPRRRCWRECAGAARLRSRAWK